MLASRSVVPIGTGGAYFIGQVAQDFHEKNVIKRWPRHEQRDCRKRQGDRRHLKWLEKEELKLRLTQAGFDEM